MENGYSAEVVRLRKDKEEKNMGGKRSVLIWLTCICMMIFGSTALAATSGGAKPVRDGQTDVMAGVVVNYMGKLQFVVTDRDTGHPIPGVSVEIYIPSLDRYVLFGVTDADGILELDVAYGNHANQFTEVDGQTTFQGILLYLADNNISYRVYKADWLPYPYEGSVVLETEDVPQVVRVELYQKKSGSGGNDGNGGSSGSGKPGVAVDLMTDPTGGITDETGNGSQDGSHTGGIPKTGVEGTMQYWLAAVVFFLLAGGISLYFLKREERLDKDEHRE